MSNHPLTTGLPQIFSTRSTTLTWVALIALTCGSYLLSEWESTPTLLFGLAWFKLALITAVFMELKGCRPLFLRSALALYALTIFVIVFVS